jgi:hypothetical protein
MTNYKKNILKYNRMSNTKDTNNNGKIGKEQIYFSNFKLHEKIGVGFILSAIIVGGIYIYNLPEDHSLKEAFLEMLQIEKDDHE